MDINFTYIAVVLGVVLLSMTLHEAMHAYVAYWLGDHTAKATGRLTLNPIAHIDPFLTILLPVMLAVMGLPVFGGAKPVPFTPFYIKNGDLGIALMAAAGPLTNFILASLFFGVWALTGGPQGLAGLVLQTGVYVNLGFFIFNMIPVPPLDGSRVLYAIAPESIRKVMEIIEQYGLIAVFLIVMVFNQAIGVFMANAVEFFVRLFGLVFGVSSV